MARARHVRVGATVGTVGTAALLLRAVDLDVEQLEVVDVEALHLRLETIALSGESSAEVTGLQGHSVHLACHSASGAARKLHSGTGLQLSFLFRRNLGGAASGLTQLR